MSGGRGVATWGGGDATPPPAACDELAAPKLLLLGLRALSTKGCTAGGASSGVILRGEPGGRPGGRASVAMPSRLGVPAPAPRSAAAAAGGRGGSEAPLPSCPAGWQFTVRRGWPRAVLCASCCPCCPCC